MKLITEIPKTEEGLALLLSGLFNVTKERALWAILKAHLTIDDIEEFNDFVTSKRLTLNDEIRKFKKDAENFLETFVLDCNNVIKGHQLVFRRMHHSFVGVRNVLVKFSMLKNAKSSRYKNVETPNIYTNSYIANNTPRSNDLFGLESFDKSVQLLCQNISTYFQLLYQSFDEGMKLLKDEKLIKGDPTMVEHIYNEFEEEVINDFMKQMNLIGMSPSNIATTANPLFERRKQFNDNRSFLQHLYHNDKPENVKRYILQKKFCGKSLDDMTAEENILFGDDIKKVKRIRIAIRDFNELAHHPQNGALKKIDTKSIACFAAWCGINYDKKKIFSFYKYFSTLYNKTTDKVGLPTDERVYKKAGDLTLTDKTNFNQKLENLLFEIENSKKNVVG